MENDTITYAHTNTHRHTHTARNGIYLIPRKFDGGFQDEKGSGPVNQNKLTLMK